MQQKTGALGMFWLKNKMSNMHKQQQCIGGS